MNYHFRGVSKIQRLCTLPVVKLNPHYSTLSRRAVQRATAANKFQRCAPFQRHARGIRSCPNNKNPLSYYSRTASPLYRPVYPVFILARCVHVHGVRFYPCRGLQSRVSLGPFFFSPFSVHSGSIEFSWTWPKKSALWRRGRNLQLFVRVDTFYCATCLCTLRIEKGPELIVPFLSSLCPLCVDVKHCEEISWKSFLCTVYNFLLAAFHGNVSKHFVSQLPYHV